MSRGRQATQLVEALTRNPDDDRPDQRMLQVLKRIARRSNADMVLTLVELKVKLKAKNSQVRLLSTIIVDELFMKSKMFRDLFIPTIETFLLLTVGYSPRFPLPPPTQAAQTLKETSLDCVSKWNKNFGFHYRSLFLAFRYLKFSLKMIFPDLQERLEQQAQMRIQMEAERQRSESDKLSTFKQDFNKELEEIESFLSHCQECLFLLGSLTEKGNLQDNPATSSRKEVFLEEETAFGFPASRKFRQAAMELEYDSKRKTALLSNKPFHQSLKDLLRDLQVRHLPRTREWLLLLSKIELRNRSEVEKYVRHVIDLKVRLSEVKDTLEREGVSTTAEPSEESSEDCEWEDGGCDDRTASNGNALNATRNEGPEQGKAEIMPCCEADKTAPRVVCQGSPVEEMAPSEQEMKESDPKRQELLQCAPVLLWGPHLEGWGKEDSVPANQRGLQVDNHWGPVDPDKTLPTDRVQSFRLRETYYQPRELPNRECRAAIGPGKLCKRRDFVKCPFHGVIVERDGEGRPVSGSLEQEVLPGVAEVGQSTLPAMEGLSLRQRREDVRAHNENVLRMADLEGTEQGMREAVGGQEELGVRESSTQRPAPRQRQRQQGSARQRLAMKLSGRRRGN